MNQVKLQISIFGGKFEVDLDNRALFRAHVLQWSFVVLSGKAAFKMAARFKNDIPKDLIHSIADSADDILSNIDSLTSIFAKHIQNFIDKLKNYLPLDAKAFLQFIERTVEFLRRSLQATRFGKIFTNIAMNIKKALRSNELWTRIATAVKTLLRNLKNLQVSNSSFSEAFKFLTELVDTILKINVDLPRGFPVRFNIKEFLQHISGSFDSVGDAVADYFKKLGVDVPSEFFEMIHFKFSLRFPVSLDEFNTVTTALIDFCNQFLGMLAEFRDISRIELPRPSLPQFAIPGESKLFHFGLSFDWQVRFNFNVKFSDSGFKELRKFFQYLSEIFDHFDDPNFDLEKFFQNILPSFRKNLISVNPGLYTNTTNLKIEEWFQKILQNFQNILVIEDGKLLNFSETGEFLKELLKEIGRFSKRGLINICKFQDFMLKSSGKLLKFGENLENETIVSIRKIEDEAQNVLSEVVNVTIFVEDLINKLQHNLSLSTKTFVNKFLTNLEFSLQNVHDLADNVAEFAGNATNELSGFCYKTADLSGEILDNIQSEAKDAVKELTTFITTNSRGIKDFINRFKSVVRNVENWQQQNLRKRLGKFVRVSETLEEFLALLKNENKFWRRVHKTSRIINEVVKHLNRLPEHAQKAREAADEVADFAVNARRWEREMNRLNLRRKFKLDFDKQLRELCNEFHNISNEGVSEIKGDNLFKRIREFVTKETDSLVERGVAKLNLLKEPLVEVRAELTKISESFAEVEAVLIEIKPFSNNFSPILREVSHLPNCSNINLIFKNILSKCSKSAKTFGKASYGEYKSLRNEVKVLFDLLPNEWENLSLRKCVRGGTCLSQAFIMQARELSKKMKLLKKKIDSKELLESLQPCELAVKDVSDVVDRVRNISKLVQEFSLKDEILTIKDLSRRITGKFSHDDNKVETFHVFMFS